MAENLNVNVNVNTNPAIQALNRLQQQVQTLESKFSGLDATIAGVSISALIIKSVQLADAMDELSGVTGIATSTLMGFGQAMQMNGSNAEQANQSVLKLVSSIGEAKEGSKNAQAAFRDIGLSMKDIRSLSEEEILQKTIEGLAKISDVSKRSILATELLGKAGRNVDFGGVSSQMGKFARESMEAASRAKAIAEMNDKLQITFTKLQYAIIKAIDPIVKFINNLDQEKLNNFASAIVEIGKVFGFLVIVGKTLNPILNAIKYVFVAIKESALVLIGSISAIILSFMSLAITAKKTVETFSAWWRLTPRFAEFGGRIASLKKLFIELGQRAAYTVKPLMAIAVAITRVAVPIAAATTLVLGLIDAIQKLGEGKTLGNILDDWAASLEQFVTDKLPLLAKGLNKLNDMLGMGPAPLLYNNKELQDLHKNEMARLEARSQAYKDLRKAATSGGAGTLTEVEQRQINELNVKISQQNDLTKIGLQHSRDKIAFEAKMIEFQTKMNGMAEDQVEIFRAQSDAQDELMQKQIQIRQEIERLQSEMAGGSENKTLSARIALLKQQLVETQKIYDEHIEQLPEYITKLQSAKLLEEDRLRTLQNTTSELQRQYENQQTLAGLMVSASDQMKDIEFAGKLQKMSPLEQQFANIQEAARKAAYEAGRVFAQGFEDSGDGLTPERADELAAGLQQIADKYKRIADAQTQQLQYSQTWEAGWSEAFNGFAENATNAANMARDAVSASVNAMNSAIDRFVETGKFSFRDFATSIIQELIKIELKAAAMQIFKYITGGSSGGSIISGLLSGLGFANGGNPPMNKLSLVGEKGPELFMPKQPGTIIPNDQLAQFGKQEQVVNNYYTYNVSAIDNKSVAQFFAEHRKTMLGTVQLAQKEMPYNNR